MPAEGNLGRLFFTLGLDDKEFEDRLKALEKKINAALSGGSGSGSKPTKTLSDFQKLGNAAKEAADAARSLAAVKGIDNPETKTAVENAKRLAKEYANVKNVIKDTTKEEEMAAKAKEKIAKSQKNMGLSLLFTNGQLKSSVRLSSSLTNQMGTLFSVYAAERFLKTLVEIRGEFELQQVALRAILRDAAGADKIFAQLQGLAVKSPFTFKDLVSYTKQLSAFSVPINELYDTTKNLADISSGLGVDMSRIIIAYGQVKSAAVLRGQELRQFTEAGIPLVDELAKKFSELNGELVTAGDVFDLISKRQVPFEMIKEVFEDMTSAGGMFYKMQEKQAETLKGKLSNLTDAFQLAMNEIGKSQDTLLKGGVDFAMLMAKNFEKVVKVLMTIILTLGVYKAAQGVAFGVDMVKGIIEKVQAFNKLRKEVEVLTAAQKALNIAEAANVTLAIVQALAIAIGALVVGIQLFVKDARTAADITDQLTRSTTSLADSGKEVETLVSQYKDLTSKIQSGKLESNAYTEAVRKRKVVMGELAKINRSAIEDETKYGEILSINTEKIEQYSEAQKKSAINRMDVILEDSESKLSVMQQNLAILEKAINARQKLGYMVNVSGQNVSSPLHTAHGFSKRDLEQDQIVLEEGTKASKEYVSEMTKAFYELQKKIQEMNPAYQEALNTRSRLIEDMAKKSNEGMAIHFNSMDYYLNKAINWTNKWNKNAARIAPMTPAQLAQSFSVVPPSDWRTQYNTKAAGKFNNIKEGDYKIKDDETLLDYQKRVTGLYEEQVDAYDALVKFKKKNKDITTDDLKSQQAIVAEYKTLMNLSGASNKNELKDLEERKRLQQDIWKTQLNNITDAYEAYSKLRKGGLSETDALLTLSKSPQFKGLSIPKDNKEFIDALNVLLSKTSGDVSSDIKKKISDAIVKGVADGVDEAEKKFKEFKDLFDFYEQLVEVTGNKDISKQLAFGSKYTEEYFNKAQSENALKNRQDFVLKIQKAIAETADTETKITKLKQEQEEIEKRINEEFGKGSEAAVAGIAATQKQTQLAISELLDEAFQLSPFYQKVFQDISDLSVRGIQSLSDELDKIMAKKAYDKDKKQYSYTDEAGKTWTFKDAQLRQLIKRSSEFKSKMKDFDPFKYLFHPDGETFEDKAKSVQDSLQGIMELSSSLIGIVKNLSDSLGLELDPEIEAATASMEGLLSSGMGVARIMAGDVVGGSVQLMQGVAQLIDAAVKLDDLSINKEIESINKTLDNLAYSLERLNDERERAAGLEIYNTDKERVKNLQDQINATNALIKQEEERKNKRLEESKTWKTAAYTGFGGVIALGISYLLKKSADKSSKAMDDLVREAQEKADELKAIFEDAVASAVGTSGDYATQLGDAIIDAFLAGENAAQAWGNTVDEIINNVTRKLMIDQYLTPAIDAIFKKYQPMWETSGAFDPTKFISTLPAFRGDLSAASKNINLFFDALGKVGGLTSGENVNGMTKSLQGLTEDTGNLVVSYMNQVRADVAAKRRMMEKMITAMEGDGINVFDNKANIQLIALNEKMEESNRNTTTIKELLNSVIGAKGSTGKVVRIG